MATENTKIVRIEVRDKVALNRTPEVFLVGGNSDYKVVFDFDEAWESETVRTAIFVYGGFKPVLMPFTGDECDVPIISGSTVCQIGVTAGNMKTTTPAYVNCKLSIRDIGGEIEPPSQDVYDRIIGLIESGMLKGEQGEKGEKGDKGDAGAIKFITVVSLPTENIDDNAIYLVPIEGVMEENRYTEYVYIDGKWETIGAITVQVDHSEYVKFTDYATADKAGVIKYSAERGITVGTDGVASLYQASKFDIDNKKDLYKPITPFRLDYAVKVGITTNTETLTDEEKASACGWLGAVGKTEYPDFDDTGETIELTAGVVKVHPANSGMQVGGDGELRLYPASISDIASRPRTIDVGYNKIAPITTGNLNQAVKASLTDRYKIELTPDEQAKAFETIFGAPTSTVQTIPYISASGSTEFFDVSRYDNPTADGVVVIVNGKIFIPYDGTKSLNSYDDTDATSYGVVKKAIASQATETWHFTLADGTTATKNVVVK